MTKQNKISLIIAAVGALVFLVFHEANRRFKESEFRKISQIEVTEDGVSSIFSDLRKAMLTLSDCPFGTTVTVDPENSSIHAFVKIWAPDFRDVSEILFLAPKKDPNQGIRGGSTLPTKQPVRICNGGKIFETEISGFRNFSNLPGLQWMDLRTPLPDEVNSGMPTTVAKLEEVEYGIGEKLGTKYLVRKIGNNPVEYISEGVQSAHIDFILRDGSKVQKVGNEDVVDKIQLDIVDSVSTPATRKFLLPYFQFGSPKYPISVEIKGEEPDTGLSSVVVTSYAK